MLSGKAVKLHSLPEKTRQAVGLRSPSFVTPVVVGISGGFGTNTHILCTDLAKILGMDHVLLLRQQDYFTRGKLKNILENLLCNDHPVSSHGFDPEIRQMTSNIDDLTAGHSVFLPISNNVGDSTWEMIFPRAVLLLEGPLLFADTDLQLRNDIKVYVDADEPTRWGNYVESLGVDERDFLDMHSMESLRQAVSSFHENFIEQNKAKSDFVVSYHSNYEEFLIELSAQVINEIFKRRKRTTR